MEEVVFESLPINIEPGAQLSEYDKRMKRAARFGIDPFSVAGPQANVEMPVDESMDADQAFNQMALGSGAPRVNMIKTQIDRIKARYERFGDDVAKISENKISKLNKKITSLRAFEKPAEIKSGAKIFEDTLYLYGTDYMSTKDIKSYVGTQFPVHEIKWINDSSCTIKLPSAEIAEQMYIQFSVRPAALMQKTGVEDQKEPVGAEKRDANYLPTKKQIDDRNYDNKLGWREALGF